MQATLPKAVGNRRWPPRWPGWPVVGALLLLLAAFSPAAGQGSLPTPDERQFATLHDVFFLDAEQGWAVGDRGTIWQTADGGRNWRLQVSPVSCTLQSVWFANAQHGWAVGGWNHFASNLSSGLVLRTSDGGQRWHRVENLTLPRLRQVKFFDRQQGTAWGDPSGLFPTGIFTTVDAGRTWTPLPGPRAAAWLAGDLAEGSRGLVVNEAGQAFEISPAGLQLGSLPRSDSRRLRAATLAGSTAWLAGEQGLLFGSRNGGQQWQPYRVNLPGVHDSAVGDFHTVAARGSHVWLAGRPGSCVLHSPDGGQSWEAQRTGHSAPLQAITFIDPLHGWAVGACGAILATRDGGQLWQRQRGGNRVALLAITGEAASVPWELLARTCDEEGYLAAVEAVTGPAPDVHGSLSLVEDRLRAACLEVGVAHASLASGFPVLPGEGRLTLARTLEAWGRGTARGSAALDQHLVSLLREWRPEVVVLDSDPNLAASTTDQLVAAAVLRAVHQAADAAAMPEQRARHLEPWRVNKVFAAVPEGVSAPLSLATTQFALRHASTLSQRAQWAAALLDAEPRPRTAQVSFRLVVDTTASERGGRELFGGLALRQANELRRAAADPQLANLEKLRALTQLGPQLEAWSRGETPLASPEAWLAQVERTLTDFDANTSALALFELGQRRRRHDPQSSALAFELLARRAPLHPLSEASLAWLLRYYTSGETALALAHSGAGSELPASGSWAAQGRAPPEERLTLLRQLGPQTFGDRPLAPRGFEFGGAAEAEGAATSETRLASATTAGEAPLAAGLRAPREPAARLMRAGEIAEALQRFHPALFAASEIRLLQAATARGTGDAAAAAGKIEALAGRRGVDPFRACAVGEQWLAGKGPSSPKLLVRSGVARQRPKLDGRLEEAAWSEAGRFELRSPLGDDLRWPAVVLVAHDGEYLYLAAQCAKAPGAAYAQATTTRQRDALLAEHDRVEIRLDTDRDYATCFHLAVDARGFAAEDCFENRLWNPRWFVAHASDEQSWRFEAAIPLGELVPPALAAEPSAPEARAGTAPAPARVWGIGIERVVPGIGRQSAPPCGPRGLTPEEFGYLEFAAP